MRIRGIYNRSAGAGRGAFYDKHSNEHVMPWAAVTFYDDFLGQVYDSTHNWTVADTGGASEALVADSPSGYFALALAVTGEEEEASIYPNNFRNWVLGQGVIFEARIRLQVLPTLLSELHFGLAGDYVKGRLEAADEGPLEHIAFNAVGDGDITLHTDDTSTNTDATATGVTATAAQWKVYRIDCSDTSDIRFYIDGAAVGTAVTHDMSNDDTLKLQPYFQAYKSAGAGLGTMWIDYVRIWQNRT